MAPPYPLIQSPPLSWVLLQDWSHVLGGSLSPCPAYEGCGADAVGVHAALTSALPGSCSPFPQSFRGC